MVGFARFAASCLGDTGGGDVGDVGGGDVGDTGGGDGGEEAGKVVQANCQTREPFSDAFYKLCVLCSKQAMFSKLSTGGMPGSWLNRDLDENKRQL